MREALSLAVRARDMGEVPVGAVVVLEDRVIGTGFNQPIVANDPTAHAEIVAIRDAAKRIGNYRLPGATLYVTIEPCQMCVGAMVHARIARVVYGTTEPKAGAIESAMRAHEHPSLNHRMEAVGGLLEAECREVIQDFFRSRRSDDARSSARAQRIKRLRPQASAGGESPGERRPERAAACRAVARFASRRAKAEGALPRA